MSTNELSRRWSPAAILRKTIEEYLYLDDPWVSDVALATIVANTIDGKPLWLLIVNPPSSGKTEIVQAFRDVPICEWVGQLSENTFLSGMQTRATGQSKSAPGNSLLLRWTDPRLRGGRPPVRIMLVQDLTSMVTMRREKRDAIFGQLREIHDGRLVKSTGMGEDLIWEGYLGLLGAVTPVFDDVMELNSILGERFVLYRPIRRDDEAEAWTAMNRDKTAPADWQETIATVAAAMVERGVARLAGVTIIEAAEARLVDLARLTAAGRAKVERDGRTHGIRLAPEAEGPGRLIQQFGKLLKGLCAVRGRREPGEEELAVIAKVALDSVPKIRQDVLRILATGAADRRELVNATGLSMTTMQYQLEDLRALRIVEQESGTGPEDRTARWALQGWYRELAERTGLFAEVPPSRCVPPTQKALDSSTSIPLTNRDSTGVGRSDDELAPEASDASNERNGAVAHAADQPDAAASALRVLQAVISNTLPWERQS
jgi:hypothetical protein